MLKKELQALALDIRLLDENDNEVDMRNIEEEEHRFPRSIDKDEVIETPETEDEFEDIDEDFDEELEEIEESESL